MGSNPTVPQLFYGMFSGRIAKIATEITLKPIYLLLLVTLLAPLAAMYLSKQYTGKAILTGLGVALAGTLMLGGTMAAIENYTSRDTEVLNGFVTGKEINRFTCPINTSNPCENGYSCNCRQIPYSCGTTKAPATCYRTECDTCYEYEWEQNFFVDSSLEGERAYKIQRIDEQGARTPPRWAQVKHGDPVSITGTYRNYILGAVDSLFSEDGKAEEKYRSKIPPYPLNIYDYYRIDRLVTVGKVTLNRAAWNEQISRALVHLGPSRQANVVVVVAEGVGMDFANAVRRSWRGFKKNDIVVFAGVDASGNLTWTRTMSWSKESLVNVKLESEILQKFQGKPLEPVAFLGIVKTVGMAHFERRSMEDFAYLKEQAKMSGTQVFWIWLTTIALGVAGFFLVRQLLKDGFVYGMSANSRYYHPSYSRQSARVAASVRKVLHDSRHSKKSRFRL